MFCVWYTMILLHCGEQPTLQGASSSCAQYLLQLLLWAEVVAVATLLLAAVDSTCMQASVTLAANHLLAVEFACEHCQGRFNHAATEAQHQVECGLLLDVVITQGAAVFQLLASEDQSL